MLAGIFWIKTALLSDNKNSEKTLEPLTVLILGEFVGNADTMMVLKYDTQLKKINILSIPRDTFIGDDIKTATPRNKINAIYAIYPPRVKRIVDFVNKITMRNHRGPNVKRVLKIVNNITGLDIRYYILINTTGLIKMVNSIGGIDFNVPMTIDLDGTHLEAGFQKLTGEQVSQLSRFRHNEDGSTYPEAYGIQDFGRMHTQRDLMKAFAQQIIQFKNIAKINQVVDTFRENVNTNLDFNALKEYLPSLIQMNMQQIRLAQLPGSPNATDNMHGFWFFITDPQKTKVLVDELFKAKPSQGDISIPVPAT